MAGKLVFMISEEKEKTNAPLAGKETKSTEKENEQTKTVND